MNAEDTMKTRLWLPDVLGVTFNSSQRQRPRGTPGSLHSWFQGILPLYATHALLFGLWPYPWGWGGGEQAGIRPCECHRVPWV